MRKTAILVHLDALEGAVPLVGGYLRAYAYADEDVRANWDVRLVSASVRTAPSRLLRNLLAMEPDLVAFSVYTWNAGLVRRLLPTLRSLLPDARFVLGGVEVMHQIERFSERTWENVVVCNGEGERSFRRLLQELSEPRPDLLSVGGMSFARDGAWVTTEGEPRIQNLCELPSPWLSGAFDDVADIQVALFETNRGCPFACSFCYWGGAVGQKIYRQDLERIREELAWIAKRGIPALSLCDANFGIFPEDVEIARHIATASKQHAGLSRVVFNSSKVRPERVEEISKVFADAGLLTRHCFSMQSMDERTLALAKRTGLERDAFARIQRRLNEERMSSIVELVWPLPGETLDSFQEGVDELCRLGAQAFLVYPLHWLHNTSYREELSAEVTVLPENDPASGGELVVQTKDVSFEDYLEGLRFALALHMLKDCRGLPTTLALLDALGIVRFRHAIARFAGWMEREASGSIAAAWHGHLKAFETLAGWHWRGQNAELLLHAKRADFDALLAEFLLTQEDWWAPETSDLLREALEFDLVTRPYLYLQTPFELGVPLTAFQELECRPRFLRLDARYDWPAIVAALQAGEGLEAASLERGSFVLTVDHRRRQLFRMPGRSEETQIWTAMHAVQELVPFEPDCSVRAATEAAAAQGTSVVS